MRDHELVRGSHTANEDPMRSEEPECLALIGSVYGRANLTMDLFRLLGLAVLSQSALVARLNMPDGAIRLRAHLLTVRLIGNKGGNQMLHF
jgi:hypothetical protein